MDEISKPDPSPQHPNFAPASTNPDPAAATLAPTSTTPAPEPPSATIAHPAPRPARGRKLVVVLVVLVLAVGGYFYYERSTASARTDPASSGAKSGGKGKAGKDGDGPVAVTGVRARKGNIGVYLTGLGAVTPIYTVVVRSRVDGELLNIRYREGDMVRKGDLLIEIDPRPFQAQLAQQEGQLAKDQAALDNARLDLTRYQTLIQQKAIPEQQVATQKALVAQDAGTVQADQGQIEAVKLNLIYCQITAPITGRIGLRLVDPGNIVHASDTSGLLVITQMDPISVIFTLAEDQLPQVLSKTNKGQTLEVDAYDRELKHKIAQGTLTTIDNQIDQTTGTVRVRATFDNKNSSLFPNQFVNARLLVETKQNVVLLTSAAVQRSSNGTYVYLVNTSDGTVTVRNITQGVSEGDDVEVTSGLNPGDAVVLSGADKLQEGSHVTLQIAGENQSGQNSSGQNQPGNAGQTSKDNGQNRKKQASTGQGSAGQATAGGGTTGQGTPGGGTAK